MAVPRLRDELAVRAVSENLRAFTRLRWAPPRQVSAATRSIERRPRAGIGEPARGVFGGGEMLSRWD